MISEERRDELRQVAERALSATCRMPNYHPSPGCSCAQSDDQAKLAKGVNELLDEIERLECVPATSAWRQQLTDVQLASVQGVWEALDGDEHLGDVARRLGIQPRTIRGDAFEHAFEWARDRAEPGPKRLHSPIFCGTCEEDPDGSAKHCAGCGRVF